MSESGGEPDSSATYEEIPSWTAVVPIRSFSSGKTRLDVPTIANESLIEAFAADVIEACRTCPLIARVIVVSPDSKVLTRARELGADVLSEDTPVGINEAIMSARRFAGGPAAAILGDTPCLTAEVLVAVLTEAARHEVCFVADASGVGSTMWCVRSASTATPHFGHHSRAEHRASGAIELGVGRASNLWARARRDVDTDVDLWDARRIGLGRASAALVERPPTTT